MVGDCWEQHGPTRYRPVDTCEGETMETVYVLVKTEPGLLESVMTELKEKSQVSEISAVTGAYDIIVKVSGDYITDALGIVVRDIRKIRGVVSTETLIAVRM